MVSSTRFLNLNKHEAQTIMISAWRLKQLGRIRKHGLMYRLIDNKTVDYRQKGLGEF